MPDPADDHLWTHVRRSVTPLGQPSPGPRPLRCAVHVRRGIDLHGDTVQAAYDRVRDSIARANAAGRRELVVVTGRSGRIRIEFPHWAAREPAIRSLDPLHGGGAFRVRLRGMAGTGL